MSSHEGPRPGATIAAVAIICATGVALALASGTGTAEPQHEGSPAPENEPAAPLGVLARELTPRVAKRVERIRGLEFDRVPVAKVIGAERFAEVASSAAPSGARAERALTDGEATARLLGLLRSGESLDVLAGGAPDLAAAAYDTRDESLYVIRDAVGTSPALLEFLLAHELEHALDDQRFGLREMRRADDDRALASLALTEGAATAVMVEYAALHLDPLELSAAAGALDAGTDGVPAAVVEQLTWAYLGGSEFVSALRERRGDWSAVNRALAGRPPRSTEQIMHPSAYLEGDQPVRSRPAPAVLERRGWRVVDRGVLGEYTTAQMLRRGAPEAVAADAATGWEGDGYLLASRGAPGVDCALRCPRERVLAASWTWAGPEEAAEFTRTLPAALIGGRGARPLAGPGEWRLDGAFVVGARAGRRSALVFAPRLGLARAVARATAAG